MSDSQNILSDLKSLLASNYLLYIKTQHFHWNVTGPNFPALHQLFEGQYENLAEANDEIAERIRALQAEAPGTAKEFIELAFLQEQPAIPSANDMVKELLSDHEAMIGHIRALMAEAGDAADEGTNDLLSGRMSWHEKQAWFLRSSLA